MLGGTGEEPPFSPVWHEHNFIFGHKNPVKCASIF